VNDLELLTSPPVDLEVWLLVGYAVAVLAGARLMEALAQMHFRRAGRSAEQGFSYHRDEDHYRCPHGARLSLHLIDHEERVAVYRAPASTCADCPSKAACTPHEEGRHIYRPLAEWAETDVGRFHQWLSLVMAGGATALSVIALVRWAGRPGTGLLVLVFVVSLALTWRDVGRLRSGRMDDLPVRLR
jgi:hypothetical protein